MIHTKFPYEYQYSIYYFTREFLSDTVMKFYFFLENISYDTVLHMLTPPTFTGRYSAKTASYQPT